VSITTVEDAEILYAGFDLCAPNNSVSMTINGPAPIVLAFFINTAIRQQARRIVPQTRAGRDLFSPSRRRSLQPRSAYPTRLLRRVGRTRKPSMSDEQYEDRGAHASAQVRGTVQADILKEDQAQNTCIFSTEFALRMMGDVQQFFIEHDVRNFYSVSDQRLSHRRSRREPDHPARLHARQRLHVRRVLPLARHGRRRLRAEPVVLLLERHGPRVLGDRPRRAAHLVAWR
jgi:hypothetical protein